MAAANTTQATPPSGARPGLPLGAMQESIIVGPSNRLKTN